MDARKVVCVYGDGSRIVKDETGAWQSNMSTSLETADGVLVHRGPEWSCRLRAQRRGLELAA